MKASECVEKGFVEIIIFPKMSSAKKYEIGKRREADGCYDD